METHELQNMVNDLCESLDYIARKTGSEQTNEAIRFNGECIRSGLCTLASAVERLARAF